MPPSPIYSRIIGLLLLILVAGVDQWSKTAILEAAHSAALPREVLPVLNLVLVHNRGVSFGMLAHMQPWIPRVLTVATSAIALMLAGWLARTRDPATAIALGFITGGAVGNITDRVRAGAVTDFLDFHWQQHHWPAFNLADSSIFIGVVILVLISIVRPATGKENA